MTDVLSELERLEREATPGEWFWSESHGRDVCTEGWSLVPLMAPSPHGPGTAVVAHLGEADTDSPQADAAFIVALRNAAPQLLAVVRAAREEHGAFHRFDEANSPFVGEVGREQVERLRVAWIMARIRTEAALVPLTTPKAESDG